MFGFGRRSPESSMAISEASHEEKKADEAKKIQSRRTFLKQAAIGVAGAVGLASVGSLETLAQNARNSRVREGAEGLHEETQKPEHRETEAPKMVILEVPQGLSKEVTQALVSELEVELGFTRGVQGTRVVLSTEQGAKDLNAPLVRWELAAKTVKKPNPTMPLGQVVKKGGLGALGGILQGTLGGTGGAVAGDVIRGRGGVYSEAGKTGLGTYEIHGKLIFGADIDRVDGSVQVKSVYDGRGNWEYKLVVNNKEESVGFGPSEELRPDQLQAVALRVLLKYKSPKVIGLLVEDLREQTSAEPAHSEQSEPVVPRRPRDVAARPSEKARADKDIQTVPLPPTSRPRP